jgi:hypothetical protein
MSPVTITTIREWAQTIVLVGTVVVSCIVLVFKVGGYTTRLESAIADATAKATMAVAENIEQQKQINTLNAAELRRTAQEVEAREVRETVRRARRPLPAFQGITVQ